MPANNSVRGPAVAVLVVLLLVAAYSSVFTINQRELGVVLEFGNPIRSIDEPGLYFKIPLIQEVRRLPRTRQFWASGSRDVLEALPTKDGKKVEVSVWAIWKITDAEKFVKSMRTVENAEQQVLQRVRAGVRDVITTYALSEVVRSTDRELTNSFGLSDIPEAIADPSDATDDLTAVVEQTQIRVGREKILEEIRQRIVAQLSVDDGAQTDASIDRGIELVDVGVSNIGFAPSVREAAFERLKAFMEAIAARYENEGLRRKQEIINQTNAEVEKILGEGEEQSKRLRGEVEAEIIESYATAIKATGDFYNFQRTLEVYENALDSNTRLILTTDSDLLRMLKGISDVGSEKSSSPE
ncbi:MAG TPA: protease modulator HflC [Planctomycetes bacterium]|nr:protease modulator HflC [Fuerstiella sp.]HIK92197.1 protease modulator HflC [Planctomycetota bacterium]